MDKVRRKGKDVDKKECVLSNYEEVYQKKLSTYGDVKAPPRAITAAFKMCRETGIPLEAIDMNNEDYADVYAEAVTTSQLIAHSFKWRQLKRKRFKAETPEEFVLQWDREVTKLGGFRILEEGRERYMARMLERLVRRKGYRHVVAIIELERVDGVFSHLGEGRSHQAPDHMK
jgi:pheromone shutdown protein TraB